MRRRVRYRRAAATGRASASGRGVAGFLLGALTGSLATFAGVQLWGSEGSGPDAEVPPALVRTTVRPKPERVQLVRGPSTPSRESRPTSPSSRPANRHDLVRAELLERATTLAACQPVPSGLTQIPLWLKVSVKGQVTPELHGAGLSPEFRRCVQSTVKTWRISPQKEAVQLLLGVAIR